MQAFSRPVELAPGAVVGGAKPTLLAGPCVVESYDICARIAGAVKEAALRHGFDYVFKASFDKANRTSVKSFRSIGLDAALEVLARIRAEFEVPVVSDIHESQQAAQVATVVDVLQIPAYLCRQTDLLVAAAETGRTVNIKRGQFMAAEDMRHAVQKVVDAGNPRALLTERGTFFGYHDLVVDMRALPLMRQYAPVIFDVTHSVQRPGGGDGRSAGNPEFAGYLARAAAAAGVDGFFIETHPVPAEALSDGPNMIRLDAMPEFLAMLKDCWELGRRYAG
ncbi:MAG: 3-deoxy-8-phosphooctulonate synthase [Gammaproteobacteria bacterium]|nr:3-deoxy-8-phosphooctulonate synthase [Gammaproteobacteria bacterium]